MSQEHNKKQNTEKQYTIFSKIYLGLTLFILVIILSRRDYENKVVSILNLTPLAAHNIFVITFAIYISILILHHIIKYALILLLPIILLLSFIFLYLR